jgi:hypothetical protein
MLKEFFTNENSVWNKNNWYISPGEEIYLINSNFSITDLDSFSSFYSYNFTIKDSIPKLPSIISGISYQNSNVSNALKKDDLYWIINSEQKYIDQHEIELQFLFENSTNIDLINKNLDKVSIVVDLEEIPNLNDFNIQIFNYSQNRFQNLEPSLENTVNSTLTYSFIKNEDQLDSIFDNNIPDDHRIIIRMIGIDDQPFNISLNNLDIVFSERDVNDYKYPETRVRFSNLIGNIQYSIKSNSIHLSTSIMASVLAKANLTKFNGNPGEETSYTLSLENIGSDDAFNITINFLVPGIIKDSRSFIIKDNNLTYTIPILEPSQTKVINFSFYLPNTGIILSPKIQYSNPKTLRKGNKTSLII